MASFDSCSRRKAFEVLTLFARFSSLSYEFPKHPWNFWGFLKLSMLKLFAVIGAGVETGLNMRLTGQGDAGEKGGPPGNMYVQIKVADDPFFKRQGSDVYIDVPVSVSQAILGATVTIPTLKGEVELKIPTGSQPGDQLLLRGRGIKKLNASVYGNQYVNLQVKIPK